LAFETKLADEITDKLSFSLQKIEDLVRVASGDGTTGVFSKASSTNLSESLDDS